MVRTTRKQKKDKKEAYWGYHLILNVSNCDPQAIRSKDTIREFSKSLVDRIRMKAYGEPTIVNFGDGNKKGYSLVQLIETSNICAHFVEETNDIYLDIFSCKIYNPATAIQVVKEFFHPQKIDKTFLKRQAPK